MNPDDVARVGVTPSGLWRLYSADAVATFARGSVGLTAMAPGLIARGFDLAAIEAAWQAGEADGSNAKARGAVAVPNAVRVDRAGNVVGGVRPETASLWGEVMAQGAEVASVVADTAGNLWRAIPTGAVAAGVGTVALVTLAGVGLYVAANRRPKRG